MRMARLRGGEKKNKKEKKVKIKAKRKRAAQGEARSGAHLGADLGAGVHGRVGHGGGVRGAGLWRRGRRRGQNNAKMALREPVGTHAAPRPLL